MVDYSVVIPGGSSNALSPMAMMALQQRSQLGEGNLAYKEQMLALKQQQVDNALANAGAGRAKSDYELNQMKAVRDVLANRVSPAVIGVPGRAYSGTGVSTDLNAGLYDKLLGTGDIPSANAYLTGQNTAATTGETNARTAGLNIDNISKQYKAENDALAQVTAYAEHITDSDTLLAVNAALHGPNSPLKSMFDRMGITPEKSQADLQQVIATQGFDKALSLFSQGAAKTLEAHNADLKSQADVSQSNATTAKTQAQTQAIEAGKTGNTANERAFATLGQVLRDPSFAGTPEYAQAYALASQPKPVGRVNPQTGETEYTFVTPPLPAWAVPPTAGAGAPPVAAQANQLPGAQATAVPAGGIANTLAQLQGAVSAAPAPANALVAPPAAAPAPAEPIVTKPSQKTTLDTAAMAEREKAYPQATEAYTQTTQSTDNLIQDLKDLKSHPGLDHITGAIMGTSLGGPNISGNARAAQAMLDTIKSKGAFELLAQMRAASKTGGALGNVSDKEEAMLSNAFGTLQQNQNTEDFKKNLDKVIARLEQAKQNVSKAYADTYSYKGVTAPETAAASTAAGEHPLAIQDLLNKYK